MKYLRIILLSLLLALMGTPAVVALASDISDALFFGVIRITNADTEATNVATTTNISTTNLINGGYLNASASNSVIRNSSGADIAFMPGSTPDDGVWSMWVPTIGDNSLLSYILYTADSSGGKIRYFPDDAGMATTDDASLELGDNFTIEQKGRINSDNGTDKYLVNKIDAFQTFVSDTVSGNITSRVIEVTSGNLTLRPNATGDETNIEADTGGNHWDIVSDENDATVVQTTSTSDQRDLYNIPNHTTEIGTINSITFYFRIKTTNGGETVTGTPAFKIGGTVYNGTPQTQPASDWATKNQVYNTSPATSVAWTWAEIDAMQIGLSLKHSTSAEWAQCSDIWIFIDYNDPTFTSVTATGVASGEITVTTEANGLFFGIGVDQTNSDSWPMSDDLVLGAPLYHTGLDGSPFTTKDVNEHTATVSNAVWSSDGRVFDGTNDVISVATDATIEDIFDGGGTVIMWINPASGGEGGNARFLDHSNNGVVGWYLRGEAEAAGKLKIRMFIPFSGDDRNQVTDSTELTLNTWSHVATTYNSDNTTNVPILYVNTIPVTLSSATPTGTRDSNTGIDLLLGDSVASVASINGTMGEVRFYSDFLTPAEILDDYNRTRWKFDGSASYPEYELVGTGVPDNANNWAFLENGSMPYMESHEITIGGTQAQFIEWEYAATFTDQSANSNDATPTFRTDSSDADVTADMVRFAPISEAQAPGFVLTDPDPFLTPDTGNVTSEFTTTPPTGTFPLAPVIVAIANATSTPPQLPLLIIAAFVILAASMSVSAIIRRHGSGSIIVKIITITAVMGIFVALRNFGIDFWMIVVFLIISSSFAMGSKQLGW